VNGNPPLLITEGATISQHHSQSANAPWLRDDIYTYLNGYRVIWINATDAAARGIGYGDVVKVYNNRAQVLFAAKVTQRVMPGVVWIPEGGHPKQMTSGVTGVGLANQTTNPTTIPPLDMGGAGAYLAPPWQSETICNGNIVHSGLVQVALW